MLSNRERLSSLLCPIVSFQIFLAAQEVVNILFSAPVEESKQDEMTKICTAQPKIELKKLTGVQHLGFCLIPSPSVEADNNNCFHRSLSWNQLRRICIVSTTFSVCLAVFCYTVFSSPPHGIQLTWLPFLLDPLTTFSLLQTFSLHVLLWVPCLSHLCFFPPTDFFCV